MSINEPLALIRRHRFAEALPLLAHEVRAHPDDPYAAYYLGYAFVGAQDPRPAVTLLTNLLQHHPDFTDARSLLGLALIRTSEFPAATREYQEVLKRDPQHAGALLGLGMIHYWKKETALAQEYLGRALRRNPNARDALVFLADMRFADGDVAGALNALRSARRLPAPALAEVSQDGIDDRLARFESSAVAAQPRGGLPAYPAWVQATVAATLLVVLVSAAGLPGAWVAVSHYQHGKQRLMGLDFRGCAAEMSEVIASVSSSSKAWAYEAYCSLRDGDKNAGLSAWYTARGFEPNVTLDSADDQQDFAARLDAAQKPRRPNNEQRSRAP